MWLNFIDMWVVTWSRDCPASSRWILGVTTPSWPRYTSHSLKLCPHSPFIHILSETSTLLSVHSLMTNIESGQLFSFTDRVFEDALTACHLSAYLGTSNLSLGPNFPTFVRRKTRPIHMMRPQWPNWTLLTSWELIKLDLSWNAVTSCSEPRFNIICHIWRASYVVIIILISMTIGQLAIIIQLLSRKEIHQQRDL